MNAIVNKSFRRKITWSVTSFLVISALASVSFIVRAQKREASALTDDKGRFVISVNGQPVGTEDFSIVRSGSDWIAKGTTELRTGQETSRVTGELRLNSSVQPMQYVCSTASGKKITSTTTFAGSSAHIILDLGEGKAPIRQDFTFASPVVVLDDNLYYQYEILARAYNWKTGGAQTFAVFIPQEQAPGTITAEAGVPITLDGAKYEQLTVRTPDLEVTLYLDSSHRLMRLIVPASKAEIRRQ
jgi:hypothetical protein